MAYGERLEYQQDLERSRVACRDAEEDEARSILGRYCVERAQFAAEWDHLIRIGGAEPGDTGHWGGPLRRGWVDLEQRIRPKDDIEILQQAAQGDEGGLKHYEHALELGVDETIRSVAQRQMQALRAAVDALPQLHSSTPLIPHIYKPLQA